MSDKKIKDKLKYVLRKKDKMVATNIFKLVKRDPDGVFLILHDGLEAKLISSSEIMIKGTQIKVTIESSDGPIGQKKFIPSTIEGIKSAEAALQHKAYENGLSSEDATETRSPVANALQPTEDKDL